MVQRCGSMVRRTFALLLCVLPALSAQQTEKAERLAKAFAAIDRAAEASTSAGMVIGVTNRTQVLKVGAYGYADLKTKARVTPETLFEIGSVSKSFTAIALMELFDEGRFDPQAPIGKYLPWFEVKSGFRPITGRDLLTHTAGLQNYRPDLSSMPFAAWSLRDFEPSYAPGEHFWYSNLGFQTLGYALEHIEGASYDSIIQRRVLNRAGMHETHAAIDNPLRAKLAVSYNRWPYTGELVEEPWFEYLAADGSISSTAGDMLAYARLILNRGATAGGRVLSDQAFAALTKPALNDYACGLIVRTMDGDTIISHNGGIAGFSTVLEMHMNDDFGVIFMGNGGLDRAFVQWVVRTVTAAIRNQPLPEPPAKQDSGKVTNAADYAGVYSNGGKALEFIAAGDRLSLKRDGNLFPLSRLGADRFLASGDSDISPLVFGRDKGKVVEVSRGPDWFTNPSYAGPNRFNVPPEYSSYCGSYVNHNPEGGAIRIFLLKGKLMMSGSPLVPVGPATFRPGGPDYSPERVRFDTFVEGRALRMWLSGMPMYRFGNR
jgi:CubicO group peptidase (beta-lactamase class C family)